MLVDAAVAMRLATLLLGMRRMAPPFESGSRCNRPFLEVGLAAVTGTTRRCALLAKGGRLEKALKGSAKKRLRVAGGEGGGGGVACMQRTKRREGGDWRLGSRGACAYGVGRAAWRGRPATPASKRCPVKPCDASASVPGRRPRRTHLAPLPGWPEEAEAGGAAVVSTTSPLPTLRRAARACASARAAVSSGSSKGTTASTTGPPGT